MVPLGEIELKGFQEELIVQWKIKDFSSLSRWFYYSRSFSFASKSWSFMIYPNRDFTTHQKTYLSLYLRKISRCSMKLKYSFGLKTTDEKKVSEKHDTFHFDKSECPRGWPGFLSRSELLERKSELLPSDTLTVICTLKCPDGASNNQDCVTNINCLWMQEKGIDVTFVLGSSSDKTEVFAHQLVLAVRSSYFAEKFYAKERNPHRQIIPLEGIDPKAFGEMIRYCYDNEPCLETAEEACDLFSVATQFQVISLVNVCHMFLLNDAKIEPRNVFRILKISKQIEDEKLSNKCLKVLTENSRDVMASYELSDVTSAMVRIILELPKVSLSSEYELIDWVFRWAKSKAEKKDSNHKNARDYLSESILHGMNFLSLTGEEYAKLCKDYPTILTPDEKLSIALNLLHPNSSEMPDWYDKDLKSRVHTGSKK